MGHIKKLPADDNAEKSIIASLLCDPEILPEIINIMQSDFFCYEKNKKLFDCIKKLYDKNINPDIITVSDELRKENQDVDSYADYMTDIINNLTTASSARYYCDIVIEKYRKRKYLEITTEFSENLWSDDNSVDNLKSKYESEMEKIRTPEKNKIIPIDKVVDEVWEDIDKLSTKKEYLGLQTGFKNIDQYIGGMKEGNNIVIAGRPSHGKTVLGLNICQNVMNTYKKPILIFTFETPVKGLVTRILYSLSGVDENVLKRQEGKKEDFEKLQNSIKKLKELPYIYIVDNPYLTSMEIRSITKQFQITHPDLCLVMVDYLQEIVPNKYYPSRTKEVEETSTTLNRMAKELKIPLLNLVQLSREPEKRADNKPIESDLKWSGQIEQDADIILLLFYKYKYSFSVFDKNTLEVAVAKGRDCELGKTKLYFKPEQKKLLNEEYL